ncbi:MAG: prenyltransferase [Myxococcota bacterium]|jgi:1,4-dihydroxy-2-naphthoate octaprenyltransferase|nr:prenyltransferase [Myxococcota bacterium]
MVNVAMWGKALMIIPRIDKKEWDRLDVVSRWLIATRAAVFIMTAVAAGIGGLLAYRDGAFDGLRFGLCLLGLVFAHGANNLLNDWTDHKKGIDKDNYYRSQYGPQPLEHGLLSERQQWMYISVTGALALVCGVVLVAQTGWTTLGLLVIGAFFVLFYTWPLKYIGLGEPSVLLVWGPLMVGGTYYVVTGGKLDVSVVLMSLAYALGPTTVLFGKHTDKLEEDRRKRVHTLPVIVGQTVSRFTTIGLWIAQYALIGYLVWAHHAGLALLVVLLAVPKLVWASRVFSRPRPLEAPADLPPNVWPLYLSAHAFVYNRLFGALFILGLLADVVLERLKVY